MPLKTNTESIRLCFDHVNSFAVCISLGVNIDVFVVVVDIAIIVINIVVIIVRLHSSCCPVASIGNVLSVILSFYERFCYRESCCRIVFAKDGLFIEVEISVLFLWQLFSRLVLNILPTGMVGLMMAVMMAALMSSLSSAFNSSATIFTVDVWDRFRPKVRLTGVG